jgi:hypothetical protein
MQKLVNVVALLSGLVSLSVVGGGAYLYLNKDAMIEDVRVKATEEITKAITEALPGMIDSAMPELPEVTGGIVPESCTISS